MPSLGGSHLVEAYGRSGNRARERSPRSTRSRSGAAIEQGFFQRDIEGRAYAAQREIEEGSDGWSASTRFDDTVRRRRSCRSIPDEEEVNPVVRVRASRIRGGSRRALDRFRQTRGGSHVMPASLGRSRARTLGEIVGTSRKLRKHRPGTEVAGASSRRYERLKFRFLSRLHVWKKNRMRFRALEASAQPFGQSGKSLMRCGLRGRTGVGAIRCPNPVFAFFEPFPQEFLTGFSTGSPGKLISVKRAWTFADSGSRRRLVRRRSWAQRIDGHLPHNGLRAVHIRRHERSAGGPERAPSLRTQAFRSSSILTGSVCRVKPMRRERRATCVSTTKPSSLRTRLPRTTLAAFGRRPAAEQRLHRVGHVVPVLGRDRRARGPDAPRFALRTRWSGSRAQSSPRGERA